MERIVLKTVQPADIEDIIELAAECRLSYWSRQSFLDELRRSDSIMLRAESEDLSTLGFLVGRIVSGGEEGLLNDAEIYNIGVLERFRGRGIGGKLMNEFIDRCKAVNVNEIWLDVRASNQSAISFYERFGFAKYTIRKSFYTDPLEDAIMMNMQPQKAGAAGTKNRT